MEFLRKIFVNFIFFIFISIFNARAQEDVDPMARRLAILINTDRMDEMDRLIDSAKFNSDIGKIHGLTLFHYAMLSGSDRAFDRIFLRIRPTSNEDLDVAAKSGNTRYFLEVLHNRNTSNLEDYEAASSILCPLSSASKKKLLELLLKEDEISEEDMEFKFDFTDPDTIAIRGWIDHMRNISSLGDAEDFFAEIALEEEVKDPGKGSAYLMERFVRNVPGTLRGYRSEYFAQVFQAERWDLVDFFIARKVKYSLSKINISLLKDPDRALGYFVREQLIDHTATISDLVSARDWRPPYASFTVFKDKKEHHNETVNIYNEVFGYNIWLTGNAVQLNATTTGGKKPFASACLLRYVLNLREREVWTENCANGYRIIIPASDLSKPWEYHGMTINNNGQGTNGIVTATVPVIVRQNGTVIDTVRVDSEVKVNRAFGPVEISAQFKSLESYGLMVTLHQRPHEEKLGFTIRERLKHYQVLSECLEKHENISSGSWESFDARTFATLTSAQLFEAKIPQAVAGELRIAMRALAEQSEFSAKFSNFVYSEMLGGDLTQTIDPFLSSTDEVIREQALELTRALDRRAVALNLLQADNIATYAEKIRSVKTLVLEFAQYFQNDELEGAIRDVLRNLSPELQHAFKRNVSNSLSLLAIETSSLSGKGQIILKSVTTP